MKDAQDKSKILVVDDNPNNIYSFHAVLKAPDIELLAASSGDQALQLMLDHPEVALILMDVQMPGMDGFETADLIRAYPKFQDIPILFITAIYRSDEFARQGFRSGASDYITKPVDNEILKSKVNVFLTLHNQKRQLAREIEARRQAEAQVRHLNTILQAIRSVNQLIVREKDPVQLVQRACDHLIESRGFQSAWIALLEGGHRATASVQAGLGRTFAPMARAMERGEFPPCGRRALSQAGRTVFTIAPEVCFGCPAAAAREVQARMICRLEYDAQVYGLLSVCFPSGIAVDQQEQALLAEVGDDLAYALHSIEQEKARRQAEEALIQAERLSIMGRIAASLAHEINNPLQSVVGCLGLASNLVAENEAASRYMDVAMGELKRTARIVQQMRDLGRPGEGHSELVRVSDLMETVLTLTHNRAQTQNVRIAFAGEQALSPVPMVPDRIRQVFLNLVLNAIDAMPEGGELRIVAASTTQPAGVQISFADTGVGIAPEEIEHVFDAFYSTKIVGLGLGLYISRNVLQEHDGWIDVQSEVGQGTTFTMWLPGVVE